MADPENNKNSLQRIIQELSATLYSIGDGVLSTDEKGRIRRMNPVAEKLTGWKQEEALDRPVDEVFCIINEHSRNKVENPVDLVLKEGRIIGLANHTLLVAKDGSETPIADSGAPIVDEDGRIMGAVLVFRDQTQEREARQALFEAQRKMSTLVSNLPGMAYRCALDKDWTMEFVSQGAQALTGYEPEELAKNTRISYGQIIHPQDRQFVWDTVMEAVSKSAPFTINYRIIDAFGAEKFVWERGRAVLNEDGRTEALEGFISDISLRTKAQMDLNESEEELATIYKYAPFILMVVDEHRRVLKVNDFAAEFCWRTAEEMLGMYGGQALRCVWADDDPAGCGFGPKCPSCILRQTVLTTLETGQVHHQVETELPFIVKGQRQNLTLLVSTAKIHVRQKPRVLVGIMDITAAKKAQKALAESEAKYRLIAENADDVISLQDMDLNFTYVSPSIERLRGFAAEEAITHTIEQILTPASLELVTKVYAEEIEQEAFKNRQGSITRTLELEEYKKDGSTVWVELTASLLQDEDGKPTGILSVTRDITARKKAEYELEKAHALLEAAIEQNPAGILIADAPDVKMVTANQAAIKIRGQAKDSLISIDVTKHTKTWQVYHTDGVTPYDPKKLPLSRAVLEGAVSKDVEVIIKNQSGENRWVSANAAPIRDKDGKIIAGVVVFLDITQRKAAEKALAQSEAKHRLLADNTLDVIWTMDMETRFAYVNPAIKQMFGFEPKEWVGSLLSDHCDAHEMAMMSSLIAHELEHGNYDKGVCFETVMLRKDNSPIDVEILASFILDEKRRPVGIQGTTRDISERKAAQKEKEILQAQLAHAHKLKAVGQLAGGVAHDFNNMLGVIIGHAELALMKLDRNDSARKDMLAIHEAGNRSAKLVSQLLAFARRQPISPRILDLNAAVEERLAMLEKLASERVSLTFKPGAPPCTVKMDPTQIDSILTNLVLNARDAAGASGQIFIETSRAGFDQEFCNKNPDFSPGDFVLLAVRDNGCGMDETTLENIFNPFFTTKEVGQGAGLGLPTVWGIVQQNKGFIFVKSSPGKGAVFNIYLPFNESRLPAKEFEAKTPEKHCGNETILLVEDEPMLLKPTKALLELWGYKVLAAETPAKAIEIANTCQDKIDLLFSDIIMPNMNGLELWKQLKNLCPAIKCLFMSGYTADVISKQGIMQSEFAFLEKPFRHTELSAKLKEALGRPVQEKPE
jgi:PAS domain S-box-containing protein